jgi:HSP20 family protein
MELVTWKPYGDPGSYRREIDGFFNRYLRENPSPEPFATHWLPPIEISESKDKVLVRAELPGLDAKDVAVSVSGDLLTIKGEKHREDEEKEEHFHYAERYYGSFQRSVRLSVNVQVDRVEAAFDKGVLKITLPKVEGAEKKEIQIKDT